MLIDLHTHTTASDGTFAPNDLIALAKQKKVEILSITDHDAVDGLDELANLPEELVFISGVEISAEFPKTLHILGYGFDEKNQALRKTLNDLQEFRKNRNLKMINKMKKYGFDISWEELKEEAKGEIVGRPHFANIMFRKGYVDTYQEAFDKYLKKGAPLYLNKKRLEPDKAIELILNADGIPVMAHPYQTKLDDKELEKLVKQLKDFGLMGIEVFYSQHSDKQIKQYLEYSQKYDLLITGGSDFHGENKPEIKLGQNVFYNYIFNFLHKVL